MFEKYAALTGDTVIPLDRLSALYQLSRRVVGLGDFVECGVYRGGSAKMLSAILGGAGTLWLYDTFTGMPECDPSKDRHQKGDFADTTLEAVQKLVPNAVFRTGFIPETFTDLPERIAFAHIDVDIYRSVWDCCTHIYPRLISGGVMVFDDYGCENTPGCREAVDAFFADTPDYALALSNEQAVVIKR